MADKGFNGSTIQFGSKISNVNSISFSENGNPVDVTDTDDTFHTYVIGIKDIECNVGIVGITTLDVGDTGAVTVTWNDGITSHTSMTTGLITSVEVTGSLDGELGSTVTIKPLDG